MEDNLKNEMMPENDTEDNLPDGIKTENEMEINPQAEIIIDLEVSAQNGTLINKDDKKRLYFFDNIKIFLTMLVIIHHVGQPYGPGGFWRYISSLGESTEHLGRFFGLNAAYFMGFFFLISGYFTVKSYDKNEGKGFLKNRLIKLGIPLLFVFLIMMPLVCYSFYMVSSGNTPMSFFQYYIKIWFGAGGEPAGYIKWDVFPEMNFGHAWYIEHLLVYTVVYFIIRKIFKKKTIKQESKPFTIWKILLLMVIVAGATAIIMIWYDIDYWTGLLGFFQVELAHWPQYLILFVTGIIAYRKNWIFTLKARTGYILLGISIVFAAVSFIPAVRMPGMVRHVCYAIFCVCIIFGIITLFREKFNKTNPFLSALSKSSYAAYLIHFPIAIALQYALDKVSIGGVWGKFITVSILSIVVSYGISYLLTKVKFIKKVLI